MNEKLLDLDALSFTKYWLMRNAKIREEIDHGVSSLHDDELCATDTTVAKSATADTTDPYSTRVCERIAECTSVSITAE